MKRYPQPTPRLSSLLILIFTFAADLAAQIDPAAIREQQLLAGSDDRWWFMITVIVVTSLGLAFYLWKRSHKGAYKPQYNYGDRYRRHHRNNSGSYNAADGVDEKNDLEWLRRSPPVAEVNLDTKLFQEKMRKQRYAQLPINSFTELMSSGTYAPLPISSDPSLICAIDMVYEELEEDETVRAVAVKILTAFRTRNSVDALSQIALYDLSSNLRAKAVATLTEFDHESVFEPLLLACADPTREVRAAAARGLFRLNIDRADAWRRLIETKDGYRMSNAARAASDAGIVLKSFDRLVNEDLKVAYEAFVLAAFLIHAGETTDIFESIKSHKDERVRFALLHVLKVIGDERTLEPLNELRSDGSLPTDVAVRVRETYMALEAVPA